MAELVSSETKVETKVKAKAKNVNTLAVFKAKARAAVRADAKDAKPVDILQEGGW